MGICRLLFAVNIIILLGLPYDACAQRKTYSDRAKKQLSHWEIGLGIVKASAKLSGIGDYNDPVGDTAVPGVMISYNQTLRARSGIKYSYSTYGTLMRLGQKSTMALSLEINENMFFWGYTKFMADPDYTQITGATLQMGFPVGIDFKFGCDALSSKSYRFCGSVGGGVNPTLNGSILSFPGSSNQGLDDVLMSVNPYIKGEAGVFGGICWKLRLMCTLGKINYVSGKGENFGGSTGLAVKGSAHTAISLIIMPFSFLWKKNSWADVPYYR